MIKVTIELVPFGVEEPEHLGTAIISNDVSGNLTIGNYNVRLSKRGRPNQKWKIGRVEGFPRKRLGAWDLLYRALESTVGDRNRV